MSTGTLYIISAPSGAGKTTLVDAVVERVPDVAVSVSHTTRKMRPGEIDADDYYFIDEDEYLRMVKAGEFLEHASVFDHHYGTSRQHIQEQLLQGVDVILDIDWQGARQIRDLMPDCHCIFLLPPSVDTLRERLTGRGQDSDEVIERRMQRAVSEMSHYGEFDSIVINDDLEQAIIDISAIFISNRQKLEYQRQKHSELLAKLLSEK